MVLERDGSYVQGMAAMVDADYRCDGHRLTIHFAEPQTQESVSTVSFDHAGKRLKERAPDGSVIEKQRLGGPASRSSAIVGAWTYRHYTGGPAFELYTADGRVLLRVPMPLAMRGTYTLSGGALRLHGSNGAVQELLVDVHFREIRAGNARWKRAAEGPWYRAMNDAEVKALQQRAPQPK
jgi:hypothetical protein